MASGWASVNAPLHDNEMYPPPSNLAPAVNLSAPPAENPAASPLAPPNLSSFLKRPGVGIVPTSGDKILMVTRGNLKVRVYNEARQSVRRVEVGFFETFSDIFAYIARWTLYLILGYIAGRVVEYQARTGSGSLPSKNVIYIAAGLFSFFKLLQAVLEFFAAKQDGSIRERISEIYGRCQEICAVTSNVQLPSLTFKDFDTPRAVEFVLSLLLVGAGNWLLAKDQFAAGLVLIVAGTALINNAISGFIKTQRVMCEEFFNIVHSLVLYVGRHTTPLGAPISVAHLLDLLEEVRLLLPVQE